MNCLQAWQVKTFNWPKFTICLLHKILHQFSALCYLFKTSKNVLMLLVWWPNGSSVREPVGVSVSTSVREPVSIDYRVAVDTDLPILINCSCPFKKISNNNTTISSGTMLLYPKIHYGQQGRKTLKNVYNLMQYNLRKALKNVYNLMQYNLCKDKSISSWLASPMRVALYIAVNCYGLH